EHSRHLAALWQGSPSDLPVVRILPAYPRAERRLAALIVLICQSRCRTGGSRMSTRRLPRPGPFRLKESASGAPPLQESHGKRQGQPIALQTRVEHARLALALQCLTKGDGTP